MKTKSKVRTLKIKTKLKAGGGKIMHIPPL